MIFARIKLWAAAVGLVLAALAASWLGGRKSGISDVKSEQTAARLARAMQAREIENEVEALDRDTLKSRARKWVRGPER